MKAQQLNRHSSCHERCFPNASKRESRPISKNAIFLIPRFKVGPVRFPFLDDWPAVAALRYPSITMHDLNFFRDHLDLFAEMARKRHITLDLDAFRVLDKERRELITENEQRKAQRNKTSDEIARLKKEKQSADALIAEMKQVSDRIKQVDERISELDHGSAKLF